MNWSLVIVALILVALLTPRTYTAPTYEMHTNSNEFHKFSPSLNNQPSLLLPLILCDAQRSKKSVKEGYQDASSMNNNPQQSTTSSQPSTTSPQTLVTGTQSLTSNPQLQNNLSQQVANDAQPVSAVDNQDINVNWIGKSQSGNAPGSPAYEFPLLIQEFGMPKLLDKEQGGSAIWKRETLNNKGFCWDRVIIQDLPFDFITIWYYLPMNAIKCSDLQATVNNLQKFNPGLNYDLIYQVIEAKGNSTEHVVALLVTAKRYLSREVDQNQAPLLMNELLDQLNRYSQNYQPQLYHQLIDELCAAQSNYIYSQGNIDGSSFQRRDRRPPQVMPVPPIYPPNQPSYPNTQPPYSQSNQPSYPTAQPSYQMAQPSYPTTQPSYQTTQPLYPTAQSSYPTPQPSYQTTQPLYPTPQPSYQTTQPLYPTAQPSYQTTQPSYPTAQPSYQTTQPLYPTAPPSYQTTQPLYPTAQPSYQTTQPLYPNNQQSYQNVAKAYNTQSSQRPNIYGS